MLIEVFLFRFCECGVCLLVSIAWIRLLKKTYTEAITSKAIKMIKMISLFFRICIDTVTVEICMCKIVFRKRCFQTLEPTKSGQEADKMLTDPRTKT